MQKFVLLFLLATSVISVLNAQEIDLNLKKSSYAKMEDGFIIGGMHPDKKTTYVVTKYDNNLKLLKTEELEVGKNNNVFVFDVAGTITVSARKSLLAKEALLFYLDKDLNLISKRESTKEEYKEAVSSVRGKQEIDKQNYTCGNYMQDSYWGLQSTFNTGQNMVDLKWVEGSGYKLFGVVQKEGAIAAKSYRVLWEISLEAMNIRYYKFIEWNSDKVFLYLSVNDEKEFKEIILGVDIKNGKTLFKNEISLTDKTSQPCFSNAFFDSETNHLFVAGNYYDKTVKKKVVTGVTLEKMDGYFGMHLDENGLLIKQFSVPFVKNLPEGADLKYFDRTALKIQEIIKTGADSYKLIGENIRLSYNGCNPTNGVAPNDEYQSYGFTVINFSLDKGEINQSFYSIQQTNHGKFYLWDKCQSLSSLISDVMGQNIYTLLIKQDNAVYNSKFYLKYRSSSSDGSRIVYSSAKESPNSFTLPGVDKEYVELNTSTKKYLALPVNQKYSTHNFLNSKNSYFIYSSDDSKINIKKHSYEK